MNQFGIHCQELARHYLILFTHPKFIYNNVQLLYKSKSHQFAMDFANANNTPLFFDLIMGEYCSYGPYSRGGRIGHR